MTRAQFAALLEGITERHGLRLLTDNDPRVQYLNELSEDEFQDEVFFHYLDDLKSRLDLIVRNIQCWEILFFEPLREHHAEDVVGNEKFDAAVAAYHKCNEQFLVMQDTVQQWLREHYPELDDLLKEIEAEEKREAKQAAKRGKK